MTGQTIIAKMTAPSPIEGADRIQQARVYGETVIISKDIKEGDLGLLFDCETQVSHEFAHENNLYRHSHLNKDSEKTGYLEDNRRIRPIRLKGVRCSGLWMPLKSLDYISEDVWGHSIGEQFTAIGDHEICKKYKIPAKTPGEPGSKKSKKVTERVPTFKEHFDTDHFARNAHNIREGDLFYITEKCHGTSLRAANLVVEKKRGIPYRALFTLFHFLIGAGWKWKESKRSKEYRFVVGSRRVVKTTGGEKATNTRHYYKKDLWTEVANKHFKDKLVKGETVYAEIVGYLSEEGATIMPSHSNEKLKKFMSKKDFKEFTRKYGDETKFTYGCKPTTESSRVLSRYWQDISIEEKQKILDSLNINFICKHGEPHYLEKIEEEVKEFNPEMIRPFVRRDVKMNKVFVYRVTRTNEDGDTVDLSWEQVKLRCEQWGVEPVPELLKSVVRKSDETLMVDVNNHESSDLSSVVEEMANSDSEAFREHIREGVCVRIENERMTPLVLKEKAYNFKVLENIIKDNPNTHDIEEEN